MLKNRGYDLFEELMARVSLVKNRGYNYLILSTKLVANEDYFDLTLNVPGFSQAKGKFKNDYLVIEIMGKEEPILLLLPDNFYENYDIETVSYTLNHGVLNVHVKAFPAIVEEDEIIHEFHLGCESKKVYEVDFDELHKFAELTKGKQKEELKKVLKEHANGHKVKNLSKDSINDLVVDVSKIKETALTNESEVETVKACDLMLHHLEHDLEDKGFEVESTSDLSEHDE